MPTRAVSATTKPCELMGLRPNPLFGATEAAVREATQPALDHASAT
jgi:hypothetical protein